MKKTPDTHYDMLPYEGSIQVAKTLPKNRVVLLGFYNGFLYEPAQARIIPAGDIMGEGWTRVRKATEEEEILLLHLRKHKKAMKEIQDTVERKGHYVRLNYED